MTSDAQTAYALAVAFDLVPADAREQAGTRLAELVEESEHRIATGFVGTPIVSDALTSTGHVDAAYDLLLEQEAPSWLYAVRQGATTVWERWDSLRPDGTVNPGDDDVVQPLRAGCGGGLAAPRGRGARARGAGVPRDPLPSTSWGRADIGLSRARDAIRARGDRVDPGR